MFRSNPGTTKVQTCNTFLEHQEYITVHNKVFDLYGLIVCWLRKVPVPKQTPSSFNEICRCTYESSQMPSGGVKLRLSNPSTTCQAWWWWYHPKHTSKLFLEWEASEMTFLKIQQPYWKKGLWQETDQFKLTPPILPRVVNIRPYVWLRCKLLRDIN